MYTGANVFVLLNFFWKRGKKQLLPPLPSPDPMDALEEQQNKVVIKYKPTYRLEPLEERKYVFVDLFGFGVVVFVLVLFVL